MEGYFFAQKGTTMREVIEDIDNWLQTSDEPIALATVVQTWGSAPRKVGAKMALRPSGAISGSVSGGCVEGAVFEEGTEAVMAKRPKLLHFGVADETAWDVGLACGGTIEVFVEPLDSAVFQFIRSFITQEKAVASITIIRGPQDKLGQKLVVGGSGQTVGTLGEALDPVAIRLAADTVFSKRIQLDDEIELFVDVFRPSPTLVMVGGVHIAVALTSLAKTLGYETVVVDPRKAFGSEARFPHVDKLIQKWPDKAFQEITLTPETAVALLTHDPKIDDPALKIVLNSPVFYVGALGSPKTHAKRKDRLQQMGFDEAIIGRIHAPIGLKIGAESPEEIALAVLAEIVKARHQGQA